MLGVVNKCCDELEKVWEDFLNGQLNYIWFGKIIFQGPLRLTFYVVCAC